MLSKTGNSMLNQAEGKEKNRYVLVEFYVLTGFKPA